MTNTKKTIKDLIGNGEMANDVIFTEDQFEWFKSDEDGYIYTRNTETGRNTRYNAEGQNGKRISDAEYFAKCNDAMARFEAKYEPEEALEEPEAVEEAPKAATAPKAKKTARRAKKAAFRMDVNGTEVTLTEKQVDFIQHLPDTCFWEDGLYSTVWTDVLCDEIGGQFANKPMTVGAMISTICEKGLGVRGKQRVNGRNATYFALTEIGRVVAKELGLN